MKPRTQLQKRVAELSAKLPPLSDLQRAWVEKRSIGKLAYYHNGLAWCSCCGFGFQVDDPPLAISMLGKRCKCPMCGSRVEVKPSRKKKHIEKFYFTIPAVCKEFQVLRHFVVYREVRQFNQPFVAIDEAVQNWISPDGTATHIARRLKPYTRYYDDWDFYSPMEIRQIRRNYNGFSNDCQYFVESGFIYPGGSITPELKKRGYTRKVALATDCMTELLKGDHIAEMLIKNRQYSLLYKRLSNRLGNHILPAIRICNRNRYIVKDATEWIDYVECLIALGKDIHNAHYVCPRNLKNAHDNAVMQVRRKRAKEDAKRRYQEMATQEENYYKSKSRFFGICFGNGDIVISVITSVAEMADEGKSMQHCVFASGYHKRSSSLILSAKTRNGERLATIEISLQNFHVVQCRGVRNSVPPHNEEILQLIQDNIGLIRKAA